MRQHPSGDRRQPTRGKSRPLPREILNGKREGGAKGMKSLIEQMEENKRIRRLERIEAGQKCENEKEFFRDKLSYIQGFIQGKGANEQKKTLERYIKDNLEFLDSVIGYSVNTPAYPSPYTDKIRADIEKAGGLIQFYKKAAGHSIAWSFTDWQEGYGWLWLLQEISRLYDMIVPAHPEPLRPLAEKIHWEGTDKKLRAHLEGLKKAGYITFTDPQAVLDGTETPRTARRPEDRTILYIFGIWWDRGLIDKSFYLETPKGMEFQYSFIVDSFHDKNGDQFKRGSLRTAAKDDGIRKGFKRKGESFEFKDKTLHDDLSAILK